MQTKVEERYKRLKKVIERGMKLVLSDINDEALQKNLIVKLLEVRELLDGNRPSSQ